MNVLQKNTTLNCLELPGSNLCSEDRGVNTVINIINTSSSLTKLNISQTNNYDFMKTVSLLSM
jgi:hypothetical protein